MQPRLADTRGQFGSKGERPGETEAFESLYGQYRRRAYQLAFVILGDSQTAEDVVQEAYVALWRRTASLDPAEGSPSSWLLTVVRNRAIDHLRGRAHRQTGMDLDAASSTVAPDDPERAALLNDDRARIRDALDQLNARQRRPLELGYFGGLSQAEIARQLGVPLGTVKGRMRSGLTRMRWLLQLAEA